MYNNYAIVHRHSCAYFFYKDINECETNNTCDEHADCHDTDGSYWCECWAGFLGDGYNCTGRPIHDSTYMCVA